VGFPYAIIKKYSEDNGGYQAALLTYYGFLSLFPLLLVATSILQIILHSNPNLRSDFIQHATHNFPVLGEQLQTNIHTINGAGIAFVIGILLTIWGAKGVADVFQYSLNHIWQVPVVKRPGFPRNALKSLAVIAITGGGLVAASLVSGWAAGINHSWVFRIVAWLISIAILYWVFWTVFRIGPAGAAHVSHAALLRSSLTAAIGVQILQIVGGYLVTHELSKLKHLYGAFAITLGLLFWIYLEARVVMYSAEVGFVYDKKLWPRSLDQSNLTEADRRVLKGLAKKEQSIIPEKISVGFKGKKS
jgi:membrane protein